MIKVKTKTDNVNWGVNFPALMESRLNGAVVLFVNETSGTTLRCGTSVDLIGEYSESWITAYNGTQWRPFSGEITLYNSGE